MNDGMTDIDAARSLRDRAYDLLGDMLVERDARMFAQATDDASDREGADRLQALMDRQDRLNMENIRKYCRRQRTHRFFRHTLPRIGQVAAIVIAVASLGCGVGFAASRTVRVKLMRLLLNVERQYTEVSLVEDADRSFDVPAEWRGACYPSFLPAYLEAANVIAMPNDNIVDFRDIRTGSIAASFIESGASAETNIDTENAQLSTRSINGNLCHVAKKDDATTLFWTDGARLYVLACEGIDEDDAVAIAEGVRRIR